MKKSNYYVICKNNRNTDLVVEKRTGYEWRSELTGIVYCCCQMSKKNWALSEKSTGFAICFSLSSRKDCFEFVNAELDKKIANKIKDVNFDKYKKIIADKYFEKGIL